MINWRWVIFLIILFNLFIFPVSAQSEYVLPYPSFMPGSPFYKINLIKDEILKYWYFGSFGQFKYNLKQSDKYLVEAKTLFEYKQYLLGSEALKKSNAYFKQASMSLAKAKQENKNTANNLNILKAAGEKHVEVLSKLRSEAPENFNWVPEKDTPRLINLWKDVEDSIKTRREK